MIPGVGPFGGKGDVVAGAARNAGIAIPGAPRVKVDPVEDAKAQDARDGDVTGDDTVKDAVDSQTQKGAEDRSRE
jgi:hypothetical protein